MTLLRAIPHQLQHVLRIAHLDRIRPEAIILPGCLALLAGALARPAVACLHDGLGLGVVGAKGQGEAVLGQILAGRAVGARADELPFVFDVADLDARVGGRAAVGTEGAGLVSALGGGLGRGEGGRGEGEEGGEVLHFEGCFVGYWC